MSNLQTHIASLEALIDKANALPTEKKIQETKTVTPSTSSQTVQPDSGYDGLGKVTINAMPTGSVGAPSISIDANGKITATAAVDAGYVDGTDKTGTKTMTTQAAKTVTPTKSSQTAVAKNVYTTGVVTVGAIPDKYQDVSGVTATAARTAKGDVFVDADGVEQTGALVMDKVLLRSSRVDEEMGMNIMHEIVAAHAGNTLATSWDQFGSALASQVLEGNTFTSGGTNGSKTSSDIHYSYEPVFCGVGTMPNNGSMSKTIDGLNTKSATIPAGYTSGGTVSLDSTIDNTANSQAAQIAEIKAMLEGKSAGGSGGSGITLVDVTLKIPEAHFYFSDGAPIDNVRYTTISTNGSLTLEDLYFTDITTITVRMVQNSLFWFRYAGDTSGYEATGDIKTLWSELDVTDHHRYMISCGSTGGNFEVLPYTDGDLGSGDD